MSCVFCKIVAGNYKSYKVWEDENHLAFLSIFPNTEGTTVVIPKNHYSSYVLDVPDSISSDLFTASKKVCKLLDENLPGTMRTGIIFEGFGVDHLHAKLFPLKGNIALDWEPINSSGEIRNKFFRSYEGYISSHDCNLMDAKELERIQNLIVNQT